MSAVETHAERKVRVAEERSRIEVLLAELYGVDVSQPGWRREYERRVEVVAERNRQQFVADPDGEPLTLIQGGRADA